MDTLFFYCIYIKILISLYFISKRISLLIDQSARCLYHVVNMYYRAISTQNTLKQNSRLIIMIKRSIGHGNPTWEKIVKA